MPHSTSSESPGSSHAPQGDRLPVRVVVVDDHALLRDTIRHLLAGVPDIEWVGEAVDGAEAVDLVAAVHPDVVLMDLSMPGTDGLSATRQIVDSCSSATRVLVLTSSTEPGHEAQSLAAGASAVLTKDGNPTTILAGIRSVARGQDPEVA